MRRLDIATAGWAIPRAVAEAFPSEGSGLPRYAARFPGVEINSTFYRSHRPSTYQRWRDSTPAGFSFAVKAPRTVTHERKLVDCEALLDVFFAEVALLGEKLGPVLIQLPPSLAFDAEVAGGFFGSVRRRFDGLLACEPRHISWFDPDAEAVLAAAGVARVAADPARCEAAAVPGGDARLAYWRLHGSPRMYYSAYDDAYLEALAAQISASDADEVWCVFDNTTSGAAAANALSLQSRLRAS